MNEKLANISRPNVFSDVVGQEHPVAYLSGLILRGQVGRHVLLHGTVGSGKTTLALIYGHALLCEQPSFIDGSPCGVCAACKKVIRGDDDSGFYEYDVTGLNGDIQSIRTWMEGVRLKARGLPRRVLFLDEAHGLTEDASNSLLKIIENAVGDVVFIFATSEHHNLIAALRSRLVPLKIRPLRPAQAVALLRRTAAQHGVEVDDDALIMLARAVNGQPRDLVNALDQLKVYQERITESTLRRVFDLEYLDALRAYLRALGSRDRNKLNEVVLIWRDTAEEKLRWILAALSGIYVIDILGLAVDVDPVVEQLAVERRIALEALRESLGCTSTSEVAPFWRRLLGHWQADIVAAESAIIEAQFVVFHDLIADADAREPAPKAGPPLVRNGSAPLLPAPATAGFLSVADVKQILDLGSFLIQEHGLFFNASFHIHSRHGAGSRLHQAGLSDRFCRDLAAELARIGTKQVAMLGTVEGSDDGIVARVAVSLPEFIGGDAVSGLKHVRQWYRGWEDEYLGEVDLTLRSLDPKQAPVRFHWAAVRDMLDALHPSVEAENQDRTAVSVRNLLKLRSSDWRDPAIAPAPLVRAYGLLAPHEVALASENGLSPLSPVADRAWSMIFEGWEVAEHADRRRERDVREQQIADLSLQYTNVEARRHGERRLRDTWTAHPHARRRTWTTWWGHE